MRTWPRNETTSCPIPPHPVRRPRATRTENELRNGHVAHLGLPLFLGCLDYSQVKAWNRCHVTGTGLGTHTRGVLCEERHVHRADEYGVGTHTWIGVTLGQWVDVKRQKTRHLYMF